MKTSIIRTKKKKVAPSQGAAWRGGDSLGKRSTTRSKTRSGGEIPKIIPPSRYAATM